MHGIEAPTHSSSIEAGGHAAAVQLTDDQLLMMAQRYRQAVAGYPGMAAFTAADLLELLRDVAGRGWRNTTPDVQSVQAHLENIVEELRQLAEALMLARSYEDAHRVLGALNHVNMVRELDDFERIKWPPEIYTDFPGGPRELRWLVGA